MIAAKKLETFLHKSVPMIKYANISLEEITEEFAIAKIPFTEQNKNHVNSVYFGSLAIGADVAAGGLAFYHIESKCLDSTVVFKDFNANFIKRAEGDTYFICKDKDIIESSIREMLLTKKRVNFPLTVIATTNLKTYEPVAEFILTTSIKLRA